MIERTRPVHLSDGRSGLEVQFARICVAAGLPAFESEYRFHPVRRWRFDVAWPDRKLAVELEGAVYAGGRHTRGKGFEADCEKANAAVLAGWRILRFTAAHIDTGYALETLEAALARYGASAGGAG